MVAQDLGHRLKSTDVREATEALELLIGLYGAALQSYFRRRLPYWARGDAKVLEAEVWARVWEAARSCRYNPDRATIERFIWGVARNVLREWWRRLRRYAGVEPLPEEPPGRGKPPEQGMLREAFRQDFYDCLARLPENQRLAVLLICVEGLSLRDAADDLGVVCATAYERNTTGMTSILRCLREKGWDGSESL